MQQWHPICKLSDILPNVGVCALVEGKQVAVFRLTDDALYAIDNYDPFGKANVLSRGIVGGLNGETVVASPLYKQHFCLKSGKCLEDDSVSVPAYNTRLSGDTVEVAV